MLNINIGLLSPVFWSDRYYLVVCEFVSFVSHLTKVVAGRGRYKETYNPLTSLKMRLSLSLQSSGYLSPLVTRG